MVAHEPQDKDLVEDGGVVQADGALGDVLLKLLAELRVQPLILDPL